jgi:general secretion pathway protein D
MMNRRHLRVIAALGAMLFLFALALQGKGKADKLFQEGQTAEQKQDWDAALEYYLQALDLKPGDAQFMIAMRRARLQAGLKHVAAAQKLRSEGKLEEALVEFEKALISDPASAITIQEIKRTQQMIEQQRKQPAANPQDAGMTPAQRARRDSDDKIASIQDEPELRPVLRTIGPLKMNNQPPKVLFETVGKLAGVNVLFDSQYTPPSRNFNVELGATSPEQAFDYLSVLTHTFWKPVAANAVFVTEDNPTKHRDYDDQVVKTFYITNATSVQEFQEIATAIRTVADIRRVFTYNAQKALIVRGTVDQMALAEKLVHDLDKPKSEVVIDVVVMQANSSRTRDLAATIVNAGGTAGLTVPFVFTPRNPQLFGTTGVGGSSGASGASGATGGFPTGSTGGGGVTASNQFVSLAQLSHISTNDFSTSLPGALLNLMMSDNRNKILNSPTLRVSDGMTAELKVGQRIPYATGSFQPGVGTVGVSPLVSTQFNYIDTGVNLKIVPQVHSNSEVTLHVEVDISSVAQYVNLSGLPQPVIGQNKNTADLRMREGEVNILGGLSQLQDSKSVNGIPGLVDMPVLGSVFFGSNHTDKEKGELMIAIIPHIIRTPDYSPENLRGIYTGTEQNLHVTYTPRAEATPPPMQAEPPKPNATTPAAPAAAAPTPSVPAGQATIGFAMPSLQTAVSYPLVVTVTVDGASDLFSAAPIKIKFDPTKLRLNDASAGSIFTRDGVTASLVKDIRNDVGEATLTIARPVGSPGIGGAGPVAVLNFVAVGKGQATVSVVDSTLKNSTGQPIPSTAGSMTVTIN